MMAGVPMGKSAKISGAELAEVLRGHIEEISAEVIRRYGRYYSHSSNAGIDEQFAHDWNLREINDYLDCIANDGATNGNHAAWVGDAASTHYEVLSPPYKRLDMVLLYAEVCVGFLWEEYVGESARLKEAIATFEECVRNLIAADAEGYFAERLAPGALEKNWKLGPYAETAPSSHAHASPRQRCNRAKQTPLRTLPAQGGFACGRP